MRIAFFLISLVLLFVPEEIFAQRKKEDSKMVNISAIINYNSPSKEYLNNSAINFTDNNLLLEYLTSNSGIFVVEDQIMRTRVDTTQLFLPSQRISLGFSYQVIKNNRIYTELTLGELSYSNSEKVKKFDYYDQNGEYINTSYWGNKVNAFAISMRYEKGKYFGKVNSNNFNFGLGLGILTGYRYYEDNPQNSIIFKQITTQIIDLDLFASLIMRKKVSKYFSIELKILPAITTSPYTSVRERNPNISLNAEKFRSDNKFPILKTGASLHLRYTVKNTAMRGRR
jgi:hypothetical protein